MYSATWAKSGFSNEFYGSDASGPETNDPNHPVGGVWFLGTIDNLRSQLVSLQRI